MRRRLLTLLLALLAAGTVVGIFWRRSTPPSFDGQLLRSGWGCRGRAPFLIDHGPDRPISGFEAELAGLLAERLGVSSQFVQKYWDMLPQDLTRGRHRHGPATATSGRRSANARYPRPSPIMSTAYNSSSPPARRSATGTIRP